MRWLVMVAALSSVGCTGVLEQTGADGNPVDAGPRVELLDGQAGTPPTPTPPVPGQDGGTPPPGIDGGGGGPPPAAVGRMASIPLDAARPVDIMPRDQLGQVAARAPHVGDAWLLSVLESADTMFYDHQSIVPGYQDSFGDNVVTPIGMRPNTIDPGLINLAVPGGHGQIFIEFGVFHFPFGRPTGSHERDVVPVDFWQLPRDEAGALRPVVYWQRDPNGYTHRVEWLFPVGTVLGEMLFLIDERGERWCFEIRTRVREIDAWRVDVYRPFPRATDLADALERVRTDRAEWSSSSEIDALVAHLRDPGTLRSAQLSATHFPGAFPAMDGAEDVLPGLADDSILRELLRTTPFVSARGVAWKEQGSLRTWAATTDAEFQIVPRDYAAGFLSVDEETCSRCHRDAGRPFRDWYDNILAYGELWGEDEAFSWHPFATGRFVDTSSGRVREFNYDNREMRADFVSAGVLVRLDRSRHPDSLYRSIPRAWKDYEY
ncbi:MAG: hypothetical protein H6719_33335 [Sandaracinaceae bacterium]|nr:hypothetical protein [Sandaracinaceae bacterium]